VVDASPGSENSPTPVRTGLGHVAVPRPRAPVLEVKPAITTTSSGEDCGDLRTSRITNSSSSAQPLVGWIARQCMFADDQRPASWLIATSHRLQRYAARSFGQRERATGLSASGGTRLRIAEAAAVFSVIISCQHAEACSETWIAFPCPATRLAAVTFGWLGVARRATQRESHRPIRGRAARCGVAGVKRRGVALNGHLCRHGTVRIVGTRQPSIFVENDSRLPPPSCGNSVA